MGILGFNPVIDAYSFSVVVIPTTLALLGIALLARTRLPGSAIALAHFVVLPLALLIPLGIAAVIDGSGGGDPLFEITYIYVIGCVWALTATLATGMLTTIRLLAPAGACCSGTTGTILNAPTHLVTSTRDAHPFAAILQWTSNPKGRERSQRPTGAA